MNACAMVARCGAAQQPGEWEMLPATVQRVEPEAAMLEARQEPPMAEALPMRRSVVVAVCGCVAYADAGGVRQHPCRRHAESAA